MSHSNATSPADEPAKTDVVSKFDLCKALNWARPTLDARLATDPAFPVLRKGSKGGGWKFELQAVLTYLAGVDQTYTSSPHPDDGPGGDAGSRIAHAGEQTARQRRDAVQAEILEDQLRRNRGELIQVEVMRQVLNTMLAHLGKGLDRVADLVVERLNLPEERSADIRAITDELRRTMADELRVLLDGPKR